MRAAIVPGLALVLACAPAAPARDAGGGPATGVILHAHVWTGDPAHPEAQAIAWREDRILAVGTDDEVSALAGPRTRVMDARGGTVAPGFVDAHLHFVNGGATLTEVQLRDVRSREEFAARIAAYARTLPRGAWMLGGDWDHTHWGGELPTRAWIDGVTPDAPVFVSRLDGHMALANGAALRAAGITRDTPDVPGGTIVRDANREPTGIFMDNALSLVERAIPPMSNDAADRALDAAMTYVAAQGVTSVESMGTWDDVATYRRAHDAGRLRTRIYAVVPLATWERLRDEVAAHGRGDAWLRIGGLKGYADGSLGSHTAWMLAPFTDGGGTGLTVTPPETLYERVAGADAAGLQVMIHAIGDRGNRTVLDVYERVAREHGQRDRRFRIEHAQHLAPEDLRRFGALGVVPSMQPYHCIDDGRWAEGAIGPERAKTSYAWRGLVDSHATLAFGSDWPVAPATPVEGIYAAVTRRTLDGAHPGGWVPEQRITVEEALRAYTWGGAYASFDEAQRGKLAPGQLADIVAIDRDLLRISAVDIADAHVETTIVGGRIVYEATR
jgi:predicted amidohydrolase YtcJ